MHKGIRRSFIAVISVVAGALAGCSSSSSGGGGGSGTAPDVNSFCAQFCERTKSCDSTADAQTCKNNCTNNFTAQMSKWRSDFVNDFQSCYGSADCASVLDGAASKNCASQAANTIAPSSTGQSFCTALVSSLKSCKVTIDDGKCLGVTKEYVDTALSDAQSCTSKACPDIESCVAAALPGLSFK
jgi:hypothetical protein